MSRAQLEGSIYGWGEGAESNTVEVYVHYLRKKLGGDFIRTLRASAISSKTCPRLKQRETRRCLKTGRHPHSRGLGASRSTWA
jgi:hypothetical protein